MKSGSQIDALIREALSPEDGELWDELGETSLVQLASETFFGRHRLFNFMSIAIGVVFMALAIYCVRGMWIAEGVESQLRWFAGAAFCVSAVFAMKVWSWLELMRVSMTREIKRVELQLAHLTRSMEGRGE
ncbi:MAG: DUF6768 family protein [Longimicrobiales bacterium]